MKKYGFYLINEDGNTCNETAVKIAQENIIDERKVPKMTIYGSYLQMNMIFYWTIADMLLSIPLIGELIRPYLSLLAHYLFITI